MIPDEEILDIFRESSDPFLGTGEVADELGYSLQGTGNRLLELADQHKLKKKTVGGNNIYWLPERVD